MNDILSKYIGINVPVTTCNFRCNYCYITKHRLFNGKEPVFKYTPQQFQNAFSISRWKGKCLINFCGGGETLLFKNIIIYIKSLLEIGHFCMIVTNGTCTQSFIELCQFSEEFRERLFIKFSYHYAQLLQRNLLLKFFNNVQMVKQAGISFTVELVPDDSQIPYINEIKETSLKEFGALCHVTVPRDETTSKLKLLTKLDKNTFYNIWKTFDSQLFEYKWQIFGKKQTGRCLAGKNTFYVLMKTDRIELKQCYSGKVIQNLLDKGDLKTQPIIKCPFAHCYNGHSWLVLGAIPELQTPTYTELRNRVCQDNSEWVQPRMKEFMNQRTS